MLNSKISAGQLIKKMIIKVGKFLSRKSDEQKIKK
jgi:hypothetical protein